MNLFKKWIFAYGKHTKHVPALEESGQTCKFTACYKPNPFSGPYTATISNGASCSGYKAITSYILSNEIVSYTCM